MHDDLITDFELFRIHGFIFNAGTSKFDTKKELA